MSLTTAAVLSLALQCAPSVDPRMLTSIVQQESGGNPLALHINKMPPGWLQPRASTPAEAARIAAQFISSGYSVDLGLTQINSSNISLLGLGNLADAFDPCRSIAAAAKLISLFSRFNTGSATRGVENGYAPAVMARMHALKISDLRPAEQAPTSPPGPTPCPADDDDGWHTVAKPPGCTANSIAKETAECPPDDPDGWHAVARPPGCPDISVSTKEPDDNETK